MSRYFRSAVVIGAALALGAFSGPDLAAQTVAIADAEPFLGTWELPLDAGEPVTLMIRIWDNEGEAAAVVVGVAGTPTPVPLISRSDEALLLSYTASIEGNEAPIVIRLVPEGNELHATVNMGEGMRTYDGTATLVQ